MHITLCSSSSCPTASNMCLGTILFFLWSLDAFPANSKTCTSTTLRTKSYNINLIINKIVKNRNHTRKEKK